MAIRIRRVPGFGLIAICAARSVEKPGDIYLDDEVHHALAAKFTQDYENEGVMDVGNVNWPEWEHMEREESNNPARAQWDEDFGA